MSAEDIRIRASVAERLAVFYYEAHGLWLGFRRFLVGLGLKTNALLPLRRSGLE